MSVSTGYFVSDCSKISKSTHKNIHSASVWSVLEVQADQVLGQSPVVHLVHLVQDEVEQVETGDQCWGQVNVGRDRQLRVVSRVDRVCRSQDRRSRVQRSDNTSLCDRDSLLLLIVSL